MRYNSQLEIVTVPVGIAPLAVVTRTVKITFWPPTEGLTEDVIVVVVGAG